MTSKLCGQGAPRALLWSLPLAVSFAACSLHHEDPGLSKLADDEAIPQVSEPPANGPRLGAVANLTPVLERPAIGARELGYLHAGAQVARAAEPYSRRGCAGGWYAVRPRGFVCASESATLNMAHPTLAAMALSPHLDQPLPYAYARTRADTPIYERDPAHDDAVREVGKLKRRAGMAVVGSWSARDPAGATQRLALLTDGRFVRASDLEAADASTFQGIALDEHNQLPLAFVVRRGVRAFKIDGDDVKRAETLNYHQILRLSGHFHSVGDVKFWAVDGNADGVRWLRHRDVVVTQERASYPDFAQGDQRWADLSVVTGVLTLYEGKRAVFVTLASVNHDTAADQPDKFLGTFEVTAKEITLAARDPNSYGESFQLFDVPWGLTLSSGELIYGAYWHDRFGIDHGPGAIELSPSDARRLYQWVTLQVPEGWHGLVAPLGTGATTRIVIRK